MIYIARAGAFRPLLLLRSGPFGGLSLNPFLNQTR